MTKLIVICGATATGKSGLALALAQRCNSIIISADSRQVYREFNIGTAKPTIKEQKLVPHYLIDVCKPTETMTVADYQQQAQRILARSLEDFLPISPSPHPPISLSPPSGISFGDASLTPLLSTEGTSLSQSPHLPSRRYWTVY